MIKTLDFKLYFSATFVMVIKYRILLLNYSKIRCVHILLEVYSRFTPCNNSNNSVTIRPVLPI